MVSSLESKAAWRNLTISKVTKRDMGTKLLEKYKYILFFKNSAEKYYTNNKIHEPSLMKIIFIVLSSSPLMKCK